MTVPAINFPLTLAEMIQRVARVYPDKISIQMWDNDRLNGSYTFSEMVAEIEKKAEILRRHGIQPGDRIALIDHNSLDWVIAFFAISFCKATTVAIDAHLESSDFVKFIQGADPQAILTTNSIYKKIPQKVLPSFFDIQNDYAPLRITPRKINSDGDETIALICFTSGSTGDPKGIMLDHRALLTTMKSQVYIHVKPDDRFLSVLPLSHVIGLCTTLLSALSQGCTVTFINEIKSDIIVRALQGTQTTIFIVVPRLLEIFYLKILEKINAAPLPVQKILKGLMPLCDFTHRFFGLNLGRKLFSKVHQFFGGHLRMFLSGGAALDPEIWKGMRQLGFCTLTGYGLSETASAIANNRPNQCTVGTSGTPFEWMQVKIDPQDGEICLKGENVFRGYFRDPALTAKVFKEGWFHTGDLGYLTPQGEIVVTGRIKELIVLQSGQKAIPTEVDRHYANLPGIEDFASFGVPISPHSTSETIHAAVVLSSSINAEEIIGQRSASVPSHLRVSTVHVVESIPRTRALKIKRHELRKQFSPLEEQAKTDLAIPSIELLKNLEGKSKKDQSEVVKQFVENSIKLLLKLPADAILDETKGLFELGIDSLMATELVSRFQEAIGDKATISSTATFEHPNIQAITKHLKVLLKIEEPPLPQNNIEANHPSDRSIAIVGMSCRFPGGANSPEAFWQLLENGVDATTEVPSERWNLNDHYDPNPLREGKMYCRRGGFLSTPIDQFDASFFGITPREAETMDPQQRLLIEVIWESLEDAAIAPESLRSTTTGVFIAASTHDYGDLIFKYSRPENVTAYWGTGLCASVLAGRISYFLGTKGPSLTVDTACSSSLVALHSACKSLLLGESKVALVGGVNVILSPFITIIFCQAKMLSPEGRCKTFDASANGYARGEGCGAVVLKLLSDAIKDGDRILATIEATEINHVGASGGLTVPNGEAQSDLISMGLHSAKITGKDLDYVEAHGTGTSLGDPIEIKAISSVLGKGRDPNHPLMIGSVKTNIGHLEAAAGMGGLIKTILSLTHEKIPPHLNLKKLNPLISLDSIPAIIPNEIKPWTRNEKQTRYAGVNSFGFSGTNAIAILKEAPLQNGQPHEVERPLHLLTLSAKCESALHELSIAYQNTLEKAIPESLADLAYTANTGRNHFSHRMTIVAETKEDLLQKLKSGECQRSSGNLSKGKKIAFLFTGQGSQYVGMGKELYKNSPIFKDAIDRCADILDSQLKHPLVEILFDESKNLHETGHAQPALFSLEYALSQLWKSWGIVPDYVIGHSVGEYVAATVAGALTLENGLKLIAARARLMQKLPPDGSMLVVSANLETIQQLLSSLSLDIAAINGPYQMVLSGDTNEIQKAETECAENKIATQRLNVSHAFHSRLMDPILEEFRKEIGEISSQPALIPMISNLTGKIGSNDLLDTNYWVNHIRKPVQFYAGMQELLALKSDLLLEIGPHPILTSLAKSFVSSGEILFLSSMHKSKNPWMTLLDSLSQMYHNAIPIDWKGFDSPYARQKISLPTYPFQRQRYWADSVFSNGTKQVAHLESFIHPLLGKKSQFPKQYAHYEGISLHSSTHYLNDHRILNQVIFPASGYVEMILFAAKEHWKTSSLNLEHLAVHEFLQPSEKTHFLTTTSIQLDHTLQVQVYAQKEGASEWKEHASASVKAIDETTVAPFLETLKNSCPEELDPNGFYDQLNAQGLQYGAQFQLIKSLRRGKNQALAKIQMEAPSSGYCIHPTLLDCCFQVFGAALYGSKSTQETDIYLPIGMDQLVLQQTVDRELFCFTKLTNAEGDILSADITLFSLDHSFIGEIRGFKTKRIPKAALANVFAGPSSSEKLFYQPVWQLKPLSKTTPLQGEEAPWLFVKGNDLTPLNQKTWKGIIYRCHQVEELLLFMQTLSQTKPLPVWIITKGAQPLKEREIQLESSPLIGMIKTFAIECPALSCRHIDFDLEMDEKEISTILNDELSFVQTPSDDQIAYVGNKRYACHLMKWTDAAKAQSKLLPPKAPHYQLQIGQKGSFNNLKLEPISPKQNLGGTEISIRVQAAGLNFRDVLNALGLYPGDPGALGGECSGIITGIGPQVKNFQIGDPVLGFTSGSFATDVISDERLIIRKPDSLKFTEAAAAPIVFTTAYYSLFHLAKLKRDDKVLIHAASGGVGLAAIQLAQQAGAEIYATASTPQKQATLRNLGVKYIYDSRSLGFAEEILIDTRGTGVDIVLNSLSGEGFIEKTLSSVCKNGVFLEIGKRNIWTEEKMKSARPDIHYFIIALDDMVANQPDFVQQLLKEVVPQIKPLPLTTFPLSEAIPAFQYMQQAKHIGKIVLEIENHTIAIDPNGSYLITGGLGALGLETAKWLASKGAKHLCLVGRRTPQIEEGSTAHQLRKQGIQIETPALDMSNEKEVFSLIARFGHELPPLKGIVHAAGVLDDGMIADQNKDRFAKVFAPKVLGARYLHEATQKIPLDFFVLYSSIASVLGSPGQINYAAANSYLDSLALFRRKLGLPALSINWGPWGEIGMAAKLEDRHKASGFTPLKIQDGHLALESLLLTTVHQMAVVHVDWRQFQSKLPVPLSILSNLASEKSKTENRFQLKLVQLLKTSDQKEKTIYSYVEEVVRHTMGLASDKSLDAHQNFYQLGIDSLMGIELRNSLQASIDPSLSLSPTVVMDHPTIDSLAKHMQKLLIGERAKPKISQTETFVSTKKNTKSQFDLYCFPYAGGGPWIFAKWDQIVPPEINLKLFQPPGRGARHAEAPIQEFQTLVETAADEIGNDSNRPFALFGHSMGSIVCYEIVRELRRRKKALPTAIYVSSLNAPQSPHLSKDMVIDYLENQYKNDQSSEERRELLKVTESARLADIDLMFNYRYTEEEPIHCPIYLYYGTEDLICTEKGLNCWAELSTSTTLKTPLPGNHFDLMMNPNELLSSILKSLEAEFAK